MIRASIAMAVYNGEKYLEEQIDSILSMMGSKDELVISYNESSDKTLDIIKKYEQNDIRVHVYFDEGNSVETNFNNAVNNCKGEYIFLSDQDDVWINDKINTIVSYMKKDHSIGVVISDGYIVDEHLNIKKESIYKELKTNVSPLLNWIKGSYLGCQMAFSREIKSKIWPVAIENPPLAHDLWLGVIGSKYGKVVMISEHLLMHRLHGDNCSNGRKMSMIQMIKNRIIFLKHYLKS